MAPKTLWFQLDVPGELEEMRGNEIVRPFGEAALLA